MKKLFGAIAVAAILAAPLVSLAADFRAGQQPSIRADEHVGGNAYIAGGSVDSAGIITGDVAAAGGNVLVAGTVGGDVLAAGGNLTITAPVAGDIRAAGGNVIIGGRVGGDAVVAGGQIIIGGAGVDGDVAAGGGSVRVDAPVSGSVRIGGGEAYINAPIDGDVTVEADRLILGSSARIAGNLTYGARAEMTKESGAQVLGKVTFQQREHAQVRTFAAVFSGIVFGKFLALFIGALIVGLVFRRCSKETTARALTHPWHEIGRGLVVAVTMPVISILLLVTLLGIPLGVLGLLGFVTLMIVSWFFAPIIVGGGIYQLTKKHIPETSWKTILLGAIVFSVLTFVPVLGWIIQALIMLLSIGAVAAITWQDLRQWR